MVIVFASVRFLAVAIASVSPAQSLFSLPQPEYYISDKFPALPNEEEPDVGSLGGGRRAVDDPTSQGDRQNINQRRELELPAGASFPALPDEETPDGGTVGGGKRGGCSGEAQAPLTVLAPGDRVVTTLTANPTLYLFIPEAAAAEFILVDREGNDLYVKDIEPPASAGLVKLRLPETVSLQPGENYEWQLTLLCPAAGESDALVGSESVAGKIEVRQLTDDQQAELAALSRESPSPEQLLAKANVYTEYGLWQETLVTLEQLREVAPDLGKQEWTKLLNSVGIEAEAIVEAPLQN